MGKCRYCETTAGLFSSEHPACREKHDQAPQLLAQWTDEALSGRMPISVFEGRLKTLKDNYHLKPDEVRPLIAAAITKAGESFLQDGLLTEDEEALLTAIQWLGGITTQQLGTKEFIRLRAQYGLSRWEYAAGLRDNLFRPTAPLAERKKIGRFMAEFSDLGPPLPFRLAPDEFLGEIDDHIVYYKTKTTRNYVGASQGISVRLGPGLYYRVGAFKGHSIEDTHLERLDMGRLAYSNRALYFWGDTQRIRLSYDQILSWEPGHDTFTLWRDRVNSRPEVFRGDPGFGWYMSNVIANHELMDRDLVPGQSSSASLKIGPPS